MSSAVDRSWIEWDERWQKMGRSIRRNRIDADANSKKLPEGDFMLDPPANFRDFPVFLAHYFDVRRSRSIPRHSGWSNRLLFEVLIRLYTFYEILFIKSIEFTVWDTTARYRTIQPIIIWRFSRATRTKSLMLEASIYLENHLNTKLSIAI